MLTALLKLRATEYYAKLYLSKYSKSFGVWQGLTVIALEATSKKSRTVTVSHPTLSGPITLRTRGSDIHTFIKVIVEKEYDIPELSNARTIVDAGANIGLASLHFAEKFPNAKIIALEPEVANFQLLSKNVSRYPNVVCLNEALWLTTGTLSLFDPGQGSWGFRTDSEHANESDPDKPPATVPCVSVTDLMQRFNLPKLDLLKIDIEGSEKEVFEHAEPWIGNVNAIAIELHDRFKRGCSRAFYNATADFEYEAHKGENVFVMRHQPLDVGAATH